MDEILRNYEFIVGTYEEYVMGYEIHPETTSELKLSFATHAHSESVRALAAHGKFLVSSGSDENAKIFNLRSRKELGNLFHANGNITSMIFYDSRTLITASDDHKIYILNTGTWKIEKTLLRHESGVTSMALHPSGKMLLSLGKDQKCITWNLIKGRPAYVRNVKEIGELVVWSPDGTFYILAFHKHVDVYSLEKAEILFQIPCKGRANAIVFLDSQNFALGEESPIIKVINLLSQKTVFEFEAHVNRVRNLEVLQDSEKKNCLYLISASNDGFIKIWKRCCSELSFVLFAQVNTNCRITCLQVSKKLKSETDETAGVKVSTISPKELLNEFKNQAFVTRNEIEAQSKYSVNTSNNNKNENGHENNSRKRKRKIREK